MNVDEVKKLFSMFKFKKVQIHGDWVMCSCPFAPWSHSKGTDNHPSFGVRFGGDSHYNCFSCGKSGGLDYLPTLLSYFTKKEYTEERQFIFKHNIYDTEYEVSRVPKIAPLIPDSVLEQKRFVLRDKEFEIYFDSEQKRTVFPVRDFHGRLVGIRGRQVHNKIMAKAREYTELYPKKAGVKSYGIWYGMHDTLKKKPLILVEGERDRIACIKSGFPNVWASMGATITPSQLYYLKELTIPSLILFFDNDKAGHIATNNIREAVRGLVPVLLVVDYYDHNDPAQLYSDKLLKKSLKNIY